MIELECKELGDPGEETDLLFRRKGFPDLNRIAMVCSEVFGVSPLIEVSVL